VVVAISGEAGRETFLKLKAFNINEGFYMLSGAVNVSPSSKDLVRFIVVVSFFPQLPILRGVTTEFPGRRASIIYKRLGDVQREGSLGRSMERGVFGFCSDGLLLPPHSYPANFG
jgi:hypothetical protein